MKINKKGVLAGAVLAVVLAIFVAVYMGTRPDTVIGEKEISVEVIHSDQSSRVFTYQTDEEYLGPVLTEDGLVEGEEGEFGLYIKVVDGEQAIYEEDSAYWAFYEGEEYAAQGIDLTPIEDGDTFKLVYTYA